jgi:putative flippase GtrA
LLITNQQLHDVQTGLRAFDDTLVDFMLKVPGQRFEYEMNVLLACSSENIPMVEMPIKTIYENNNLSSHFDPIKDSLSIYKEVVKFISSSLLAFSIDLGLFITLIHVTNSWSLASSVTFANIAARIVSASFNFGVNKHLVFKHEGSALKGGAYYFLLASCILLGNTLLLNFLTSVLHIAPYIAKITTEVSFFLISFLVQKKIIFKK